MEAKLDFMCMWIGTINPVLNVDLEETGQNERLLTVSGAGEPSPSHKMTIRLYVNARN